MKQLTSDPARVAGLNDRGRIAPGYKADLNLIDHAALKLNQPTIAHDLPGGGRRLDQTAKGYVATIVAGVDEANFQGDSSSLRRQGITLKT